MVDTKKQKNLIPTIADEKTLEGSKKTTIQIKMSTKWKLLEIGKMYETYDDLIERLIGFYEAEQLGYDIRTPATETK